MNNTKTVVLGRLPVFVGKWNGGNYDASVSSTSYYKFNKVVYKGAEFTCTQDGNITPPADVSTNEQGVVTSYSVNTNWIISSNPYNAAIYLSEITDKIDHDYEFTPGYVVVEDSSYVNPQYKYLKYTSQQLTTEEKAQARANIGAVDRDLLNGVAYFDVVETL
jgi:hypothetical protein